MIIIISYEKYTYLQFLMDKISIEKEDHFTQLNLCTDRYTYIIFV